MRPSADTLNVFIIIEYNWIYITSNFDRAFCITWLLGYLMCTILDGILVKAINISKLAKSDIFQCYNHVK